MDYLRTDFLSFRNKIKNSQIDQLINKDLLVSHKYIGNFEIEDISSLDIIKKNSILFSDVLDFDYTKILNKDNIHVLPQYF